ncbi:hypothetical protein [Sphingomonas oryzagri]|jgi:hypothetical protein|uniref:Terminase n=1 Tax=Sphingomonas oryzagri TaxID=3042314 RepID=A0ABT6N4R4_9SPHN|nr:hypothetical protein [Sphingomonas oryzagri]MDH7639591.1 hypothetical protein [Sphingomonas oryzagri]
MASKGKPKTRWSRERGIAFLEHLALSSNVAASERVARLPRGAAYRQRRKDADFARAWDEALREGYGRLEAAMLDRAINGVKVVKAFANGVTETKLEFSERIQMLLYNAHRERVLGPAASGAESARERLAAKLAEMNRRAGDEG